MRLEAALLTGGSSRRMGADKSTLLIEGQPLAERIAGQLRARASRVTVLGRFPLPGCEFLADEEEHAGPLSALARFRASEELVFVAACDLPLFTAGIIDDLVGALGSYQAAVPLSGGRTQPLCALYRKSVFAQAERLVATGERRLMQWLDTLDTVSVDESALRHGFALQSANTREELDRILANAPQAPDGGRTR